MAYDAMDIARYVINTAIDKGKPVSNLKLQKILYYIQAAFLVETGDPCFSDEIERWRHGPVVVDVYNQFRKFIGCDITEKQLEYEKLEYDSKFNVKSVTKKFELDKIEENDRELIKKVLDGLLHKSAWSLVDRTHNEDPWKQTDSNAEMTTSLIKDFFKKDDNKDRIYGRI